VRLLVLTQYFWPESFRINDVVEGLAGRGHDVTVYTGIPNYPGGRYFAGYGLLGPWRERFGDVAVRRAPLLARGSGGRIRLALNYASHALSATLLAPFLARGRFDAILVYEPSPITVGIPARALRALKRAPVLLWVQDLWPESIAATGALRNRTLLGVIGGLVRWIYRGCDRVLVQSRAFAPSVQSHGVPSERIRYLPNSAEAFYRRVPRAANGAEESELPAGFRVVFAGNIGAAQDFATILAAADHVRNRKDIQWIVFGDGRMRAWVANEIQTRGLEQTFHLLGHRPAESMPRYFAQADVLLVTLRRDPIFAYTIPSKLQSYLACGKPIVAALEGEGGRIVTESGAGWAVASEDPSALADAVLAAAALPSAAREEIGNRGEAYFREHFEREKLLSRLEQELAEVVKARR
jgi:glycosyltransferase involved in cell wall biosynthesis